LKREQMESLAVQMEHVFIIHETTIINDIS
jgi:hypothetical protein